MMRTTRTIPSYQHDDPILSRRENNKHNHSPDAFFYCVDVRPPLVPLQSHCSEETTAATAATTTTSWRDPQQQLQQLLLLQSSSCAPSMIPRWWSAAAAAAPASKPPLERWKASASVVVIGFFLLLLVGTAATIVVAVYFTSSSFDCDDYYSSSSTSRTIAMNLPALLLRCRPAQLPPASLGMLATTLSTTTTSAAALPPVRAAGGGLSLTSSMTSLGSDSPPPAQKAAMRQQLRSRAIREALLDLEGRMEGAVHFYHDDDGINEYDAYDHDNQQQQELGGDKKHRSSPASGNSSSNSSNRDDGAGASGVWCVRAGRTVSVLVQAASERDVQRALPVLVRLQALLEFPFRIRSGGHHKAGYSSVRHGAVLSVQSLNQIVGTGDDGDTVVVHHHHHHQDNEEEKRNNTSNYIRTATTATATSTTAAVTVGPGVTVHQFVQQVFETTGYSGVIGFCGTVAESGFVLGGGIGLQSRLYGLGLDNVLSTRIVLVDGSVVTASSTQHADLFWALRGAGGGSFGVVTEIQYQVHRASDTIHVLSVTLASSEDVAEFLFRLGDVEDSLPGNVLVMHDARNQINLLYSGKDAHDVVGGMEYLQHLVQSFGFGNDRVVDTVALSPQWTRMYDDSEKRHDSWSDPVWAAACWTGFLFPENNTAAVWRDIMHHFEFGLASNSYLMPDVELWGGAIHHLLPNSTAFPHRAAIYNVGVLLIVPVNTTNADQVFREQSEHVDGWWPNVEKYLTGSYVNYPTVSLLNHADKLHYARTYWGENLLRLVEIKRKYDPENRFNFPMSVPLL
jgi:FAD/FMN-containing dehydrogenase